MEVTGRFLTKCPKALLLTVTALVLIILRHFHTAALCQRTNCIRVGQAFHFHYKVDSATTLMATEAVVNTFIRRNRERGGFLTMEGTQAKHIGA